MPLRPIEGNDLARIQAWSNCSDVFNAICAEQDMSLMNHLNPFLQKNEGSKIRWLIWHDGTNEPQVLLSYYSIDIKQHTGFWEFYSNASVSPANLMRMEFEALEEAFENMGLRKLNFEVLADNRSVVNMQRKFGFAEEGVFRGQYFDGNRSIDVIRFGMHTTEWSCRREALNAKIKKLDRLALQRESSSSSFWKIIILSDADSWINAELDSLLMEWTELGHVVHLEHKVANLPVADFCFCLGFGQLLPEEVRSRFRHTLVVHESDLPQGKGWSPLTWQVLEGASRIPVTLFEAAEKVDSGLIYGQRWLELKGNELIDELRSMQFNATRELCNWFIDTYPLSAKQGREQNGHETRYPRRRASDSELDPKKTIEEQFNLLRVVDNQRYPAFFIWQGCSYSMSITRTS